MNRPRRLAIAGFQHNIVPGTFNDDEVRAVVFGGTTLDGHGQQRIRTARNPLGLENSHLDRFWGTCQAHHHPEWERMRILAHVVADMANPRWRENVRARKITIAVGNGRVHGRDYILERDFGIRYWSNREARIPATWHATPHFGA